MTDTTYTNREIIAVPEKELKRVDAPSKPKYIFKKLFTKKAANREIVIQPRYLFHTPFTIFLSTAVSLM